MLAAYVLTAGDFGRAAAGVKLVLSLLHSLLFRSQAALLDLQCFAKPASLRGKLSFCLAQQRPSSLPTLHHVLLRARVQCRTSNRPGEGGRKAATQVSELLENTSTNRSELVPVELVPVPLHLSPALPFWALSFKMCPGLWETLEKQENLGKKLFAYQQLSKPRRQSTCTGYNPALQVSLLKSSLLGANVMLVLAHQRSLLS